MINFKEHVTSNTISTVVLELTELYSNIIKSNLPLNSFPSIMLWGAPGVGKSQGVKQIANGIENNTNKKVVVLDVRLLLFNPVDLRGIPTANQEKTLAIWLKPQIFQMDESSNVINILFLDEISAAPQSVQAAAYQITLDRTVGEHKLPNNCIVIAAGNRITDKSVAYSMPKALANRLCHLFIETDFDSWKEWAIKSGINSNVIGFLNDNKSFLMKFETENDDVAFATPRSWEMVSNVLNYASDNIDKVFSIVAGLIGFDNACLLTEWINNSTNKIPKMEEIFFGKFAGIPSRPERLYYLISEMIKFAKTNNGIKELTNAINYSLRLPTEFKNKFLFDLLKIKSIKPTLMLIEEYNIWFNSQKLDWDDYDK